MPAMKEVELFVKCTRCGEEKLRQDEVVDMAPPGENPQWVCFTCIDNTPCAKCQGGL